MAVVTKKKPKVTGATVPLNPGLRAGDKSLLTFLTGLLGPDAYPDPTKQAGDLVHAQIDPVVASIGKQFDSATDRGNAALRGYTDTYLSHLDDVAGKVRGDYAQGKGEAAQSAGALGAFLKGEGDNSFNELSTKLKSAGAPDALLNDTAGVAKGFGTGTAGEAATRGYTNLERVAGQGNAQTAFADTLPGIGALEGAQAIRGFNTKQAADRAAAIEQLTSQVPGMTADLADKLLGRAQDAKTTKTKLISDFLTGALDRNTQAEIARAGLGKDLAIANAGYTYKAATTDAKATAKAAAAQNKAKVNRSTGVTAAGNAVQSALKSWTTQQYDVHEEPIVLRRDAAGNPVYKKDGGGFTRNKSEAAVHTVKTPLAKADYKSLMARAMLLPEIKLLQTRYAMKPAEVQQIVVDALASAGINQPAPKPGTGGAYGSDTARGQRPG